MNHSLISHELNGITVYQREDDGYVNITTLIKAYFEMTGIRREPHKWLNNNRTKESIQHLSVVSGIPYSKLVKKLRGGYPERQGTWIHPQLAKSFKTWLLDNVPTKNSEKQI